MKSILPGMKGGGEAPQEKPPEKKGMLEDYY